MHINFTVSLIVYCLTPVYITCRLILCQCKYYWKYCIHAMNFRCDVSDIMKVQSNISHMPKKVIEFCELHWERINHYTKAPDWIVYVHLATYSFHDNLHNWHWNVHEIKQKHLVHNTHNNQIVYLSCQWVCTLVVHSEIQEVCPISIFWAGTGEWESPSVYLSVCSHSSCRTWKLGQLHMP